MLKKTFVLLLCLSICCLSMTPALAELVNPTPFPSFDAENLMDEEGARVTQEIFAEADITLVNCWATWCGPCIAELPELTQLKTLTGGKVQVLGILTDGVDPLTGKRDDYAIETMQTLTETAKVSYPNLLPEGTLLELIGMLQAFPTTFVVDREGTLYAIEVGSRDAAGWIEVAQTVADAAYPDENIAIESLPQ